MRIPTVDAQFEYRMGKIVKRALKAQDKTIDSFECMSDMWDFLWNDAENFGQLVLEDMAEWADDEDWAEAAA